MISVGGNKFDGQGASYWRVFFSNYGSWVDMAAGAKTLKPTIAGGSYTSSSGTSIATPIVSATAVIIKNFHSYWDVDQVRTLLQQTSDRLYWGVPSTAREDEVFVPNFARLRETLEQNVITENIAT